MSAPISKLNVVPLPTLNRAEEVARALASQIRSGAIEVDARLPSEQTMALQFGVSRVVIREAMARLKNEGLIRSRQGSGAFVRDWEISSLQLDPDIRKSLESVLAIFELRKGIEAEAAALAAERRTRKELIAIEKAFARVVAINQMRGDSSQADMKFHRSIAEAAHNPYYIAVLDYLSQFVITAVRVSRGNAALREDFASQVEVEHLDIFDAIKRKDSSAARLAAQTHMDRGRIRVRQAGRDFWAKKGQGLAVAQAAASVHPLSAKKSRKSNPSAGQGEA